MKKRTLNVFDIDDTLFKTHAQIKVIKNGKVTKTLSSRDFNNYHLGPGESYDFSEFRDAKFFQKTSEPIDRMIELAKSQIHNGDNDSILLTARSDFDCRKTFLQTFRDHNFPIDAVYVERAGNINVKFSKNVSAAVSKLVVLRKYINTGLYNKICVYDDSERNLSAILKLTKLHPEINIEAYMVNHDGSIRQYFR